jgi:hypothetical protein
LAKSSIKQRQKPFGIIRRNHDKELLKKGENGRGVDNELSCPALRMDVDIPKLQYSFLSFLIRKMDGFRVPVLPQWGAHCHEPAPKRAEINLATLEIFSFAR